MTLTPTERWMRARLSAHMRIRAGVVVDSATRCWDWKGAKTLGYGRMKFHGRLEMSHRVSYILYVGAIKPGMQIDHLCSNRACCNPEHLEQVTPIVNQLRASPRLTHCKRGHELSPENTYNYASGRRACRECCVLRNREWRERRLIVEVAS